MSVRIQIVGGLGAATGDPLIVGGHLTIATGSLSNEGARIYYLDYAEGDDDNDGLSREFPKQTLQSVLTASGNGGSLIVLINGSREVISATVTISAAHTIVGEGRTAGVPDCGFVVSPTGSLVVSANMVELRNVALFESTEEDDSVTSARLTTSEGAGTAAGFYMRLCRVEMGALEGNRPGVSLHAAAAPYAKIIDTEFTVTSESARPPVAFEVADSATGDLFLSGVTFDGGTVGFEAYACDLNEPVLSLLRGELIRLIGSAPMRIRSTTVGYLHVVEEGHSGQVRWPHGKLAHFPEALGATTGDPIAVGGQLFIATTTYPVFYVDYVNGLDADDGLSRERPKKTVASALAAAPTGAIIYMLEVETVSATLTIDTKLTIMGERVSNGDPVSGFSFTEAGQISVTGPGVEFRSLRFYGTTAESARAAEAIAIGNAVDDATGCMLMRCRVDSDGFGDSDFASINLYGTTTPHFFARKTRFVAGSFVAAGES